MRIRWLVAMFTLISLLRPTDPVYCQYMFLDSNGDSLNDSNDRMRPNGEPTTVDVYLSVDRRAGGSMEHCNSDSTSPLTVLSYLVHLRASHGTVTYSNFIDRTGFTAKLDSVTTDDTVYKVGRGGSVVTPTEPYRLFTLTITGQTGTPRLDIVDSFESPLLSVEETSFGSSCPGRSGGDNTYRLDGPFTQVRYGTGDWFDTAGLPADDEQDEPDFPNGPEGPADPGSASGSAAIVGYTTSGPGPTIISEGPSGLDATIGPWGGALYSNGPCDEPMAFPVVGFTNKMRVEIDVGSGGKVGFTYQVSQTGSPFLTEGLYIVLYHGLGSKTVLPLWGNPACWGTVWRSSRRAVIVDLNDYIDQHVFLEFTVAGNTNFGTETQARIQSLAITECPLPALAPLTGDDQFQEDHPWDEAHLTTAMQSALNCFRTAVRSAGGVFDTTNGSAYRTIGYQLHLREVWDANEALKNRPIPQCQFLWATIQAEMSKHRFAHRPGRIDKPGAIQHTKGNAFDATVTGVDPDAMAAQCPGLYRPYNDPTLKSYDPVHFELH